MTRVRPTMLLFALAALLAAGGPVAAQQDRTSFLNTVAGAITRESGLPQEQANAVVGLLSRKGLSMEQMREAWGLGQYLARYSTVVGQYFWSLLRYYGQQPGYTANDVTRFVRWAQTPDFLSAITRGREGRFVVSPRHHQMWAEMQRFWGAPYRWGGESPSGTDCSGFTLKTFARAGIDLPRTSREQFKQGIPLRLEDLAPGDLVFFSPHGGGISHVGIYLGQNRFAHSASSKGVAYSHLQGDKYWWSAYRGARRMF